MERYRTIVRLEEIRKLYEKEEYEEAGRLAEELRAEKIKDMTDLFLLASIYRKTGDYARAKRFLLKIYAKKVSWRVLEELMDVCLAEKNPEEAKEYLKVYAKLSNGDPRNYIYEYRIGRQLHRPDEELLPILQTLKAEEYSEKYAYELAKVYHKLGMKAECEQECADLILWFGEGTYVERAKLLQAYYRGEYSAADIHAETRKRIQEAEARQARELEARRAYEARQREQELRAAEAAGMPEQEAAGELVSSLWAAASEEDGAAAGQMAAEAPVETVQAADAAQAAYEAAEVPADADAAARTMADTAKAAQAAKAPQGKPAAAESKKDTAKAGQAAQTAKATQGKPAAKAAKAAQAAEAGQMAQAAKAGQTAETAYEAAEVPADADAAARTMADTAKAAQAAKAPQGKPAAAESKKDTAQAAQTAAQAAKAPQGKPAAAESKKDTAKAAQPVDAAKVAQAAEDENAAAAVTMEIEGEEPLPEPVQLSEPSRGLAKMLEQKGVTLERTLGAFAKIESVRGQLLQMLEVRCFAKPGCHYLVVTGAGGSGRTMLAKYITRLFYDLGLMENLNFAKTSADQLNRIKSGEKLEEKLKPLKGGCLVLENAGALKEETVKGLLGFAEKKKALSILILVDTKEGLEKLLHKNKACRELFKEQVHLPEYSAGELEIFAMEKFKSSEYGVDAGAKKALHALARQFAESGQDRCFERFMSRMDEVIEAADRRVGKEAIAKVFRGERQDASAMCIIMDDFNA